MSQVNRKGEKPASSPALDAELRRRAIAERRPPTEADAPKRVSTFPPHKPPKIHAGQLSLLQSERSCDGSTHSTACRAAWQPRHPDGSNAAPD